jgi:hypothetical protein
MCDDGIDPGDVLLVDRATPAYGHVVIALLGDACEVQGHPREYGALVA